MEANLENAIQQKVHSLSEDQQREVLAFLEKFEQSGRRPVTPPYSFIGIAHSGKPNPSQRIEEVLNEGASD